MTDKMQRIVLASRPVGSPKPENFRFESADIPTPAEGEVLVKISYMSLDPYMRGRMDDAKSYAAPVPVDGTMEGGAVGEVIASNSDKFAVGDFAFGMFGWATHGCLPASEMQKLNPAHGPIKSALGVLGMPGFTGWLGLNKYGRPKSGETLVVAAATGPVGQMVGQLAKLKGLRVVGIAGGAEKCALAVDKFSFDACLDHRAYDDAKSLRTALAEACPEGIDIYYENVAGKVLDAVLPLMNVAGRIPICGMIAWYNPDASMLDGPNELPKMWRSILVKRLSINGFIIFDHNDRYVEFLKEVGPQVAAGKIAVVEDIVEGLENAPEAFMGLLQGKNMGKLMVKVG